MTQALQNGGPGAVPDDPDLGKFVAAHGYRAYDSQVVPALGFMGVLLLLPAGLLTVPGLASGQFASGGVLLGLALLAVSVFLFWLLARLSSRKRRWWLQEYEHGVAWGNGGGAVAFRYDEVEEFSFRWVQVTNTVHRHATTYTIEVKLNARHPRRKAAWTSAVVKDSEVPQSIFRGLKLSGARQVE